MCGHARHGGGEELQSLLAHAGDLAHEARLATVGARRLLEQEEEQRLGLGFRVQGEGEREG